MGLVYAEVTPQSAAETVENGQNQASAKYKIRVNYRADVNPARRFLIDDFAGQLNGAITSGTSVVVDDSAFVEYAQARRLRVLRINDELMTLTGVSGNTLTVTRAQFGTSLANHADNSAVILYRQLNISSVVVNQGRTDLICDCVEVC